MFAAWRAGGDQGLIALKALLTMLVLWIVAGQLSTISMSSTLRALLLFCVVAGIWARIYVFRPQLFSLLLFAALLALLRAADTGRARLLWLVPPIFALWANLHGGWIVGLATLAVCSVGSLTKRASPGPPKGGIVTVCVASLAATLANPYGSALWSFMAETVRLDRATIADWQPLLDAGPGKILPWAISATFATLAVIHRRPAIAPAHAVLTIGLGLAALRVSRLDAFFSLAVVILLAPQIVSFVEGARRTPSRAGHSPSSWALPALLAGVLAIAAFPREFRCVRLDGPWMPEREAGALIKEARLQGRLLVWFDWGEYAIWHFEPALKVSFDGRRETVYSTEYINRHTTLYFDPAREQQVLKQLNADHAWLARDLPLVAELERQGWTRLFTGPQSVVLSRVSVSAATPSPIRTPACFPGP